MTSRYDSPRPKNIPDFVKAVVGIVIALAAFKYFADSNKVNQYDSWKKSSHSIQLKIIDVYTAPINETPDEYRVRVRLPNEQEDTFKVDDLPEVGVDSNQQAIIVERLADAKKQNLYIFCIAGTYNNIQYIGSCEKPR